MKLSVKERVILPGLLSLTRGNMVLLREVQALIKDLELGALEKEKIGFKQTGSATAWSDEEAEDVEFNISLAMLNNIVACFTAADKMSALTMDHMPIYDRFNAEVAKTPDRKAARQRPTAVPNVKRPKEEA